MTFDTREQARIRRAFDVVLDHVEPAPDLNDLIERASVVRADAQRTRGRNPAISGALAVIAVAVVTGGALWISSAPTNPRGATTGSNGDISTGDVSTAIPLADMPILALELPAGWHSIGAFEEDTPDGGIRGIDYTMTTEDGSGVTAQLRVYGITPGSMAESAMWWAGREDYEVVSIDSSDNARLFTVDNQYLIVWRPGSPTNVLVALSVESGPTVVAADDAIQIANALIELPPDAWLELIVVFSDEYKAGCLPDAVDC
jgi:hypothetical protein